GDHPFLGWDLRSQGAQQGGFTGPGPTGDDDVPASTDRCGQQLVQEGDQGAQATQLPQARGAVTVAADGNSRMVGDVLGAVPARTDRCGQQLVQEGVQGAQATQLPQARGAVTVAADGHGRLVGNVQDRVQPGPIGQGHVQNGSGGVKAAFPCRGVGGDATYE